MDEDIFVQQDEASHPRWLTLCHVPDTVRLNNIEDFFHPIAVKGVVRGNSFGPWDVTAVGFWTEADMLRALEQRQYQVLARHRVTLKYPQDTLLELEQTETYWRQLPLHLLDQILQPLASFQRGRPLGRVCRYWQEAMYHRKGTCPDMLVENNIDPRTTPLSHPIKLDQDMTHLALVSPGRLVHDQMVFDGRQEPHDLFELNLHLTRLSIFRCNRLTPQELHNACKANIKTFTSVDTFYYFNYWLGYTSALAEEEEWTLAIYVPFLTIDFSPCPEGLPAADRYRWIQQQVIEYIESLDLWLPHYVEHTKWLSESLDILPEDIRGKISAYLRMRDLLCPSHKNSWVAGSQSVHSSAKPTYVTFEGGVLDKRDCAVIGQYLASMKVPGVASPPYGWPNSHLFAENRYSRVQPDHTGILKDIRRRCSSKWAA